MAGSFLGIGDLLENTLKGIVSAIQAPTKEPPTALKGDHLRTSHSNNLPQPQRNQSSSRQSQNQTPSRDHLRTPHSNNLPQPQRNQSSSRQPQASNQTSPQFSDKDKNLADAIINKKGGLYIEACQKYKTDTNFKANVDEIMEKRKAGRDQKNEAGEWNDDIYNRLSNIFEMNKEEFSTYKDSISKPQARSGQDRGNVRNVSKGQIFAGIVGGSGIAMAGDVSARIRSDSEDRDSKARDYMKVQDVTGVSRERPKKADTATERHGHGVFKVISMNKGGGADLRRVGSWKRDLIQAKEDFGKIRDGAVNRLRSISSASRHSGGGRAGNVR